jgi:hypothetical protein
MVANVYLLVKFAKVPPPSLDEPKPAEEADDQLPSLVAAQD